MMTLVPRTFWLRIFWSVVPVVAGFLIFQAVMSGRAHRQLVTDEFTKRGQTIASHLASGVELGVYSEDKQLLVASIRAALRDPDVAYVVIHGEGGKVLAEGGQRGAEAAGQSEVTFGDRPSSQRVERAGERFIEFRAPITAEGGGTADEELVGQAGGGEGGPRKMIGFLKLGLSLRAVEALTWRLLTLWAGITMGFLMLSSLILYTFSRRITRPINRLTAQAGKVAAGRLDETISVESKDEIGELAVAFNEMTRALKRNIGDKELALAEVRDLNRTLEERIQQRTAELQERSRALQRSLEDVRAMGEISRTVASTLDLTEVLNTISARAVELSNSDACAIFEKDPRQERLTGVAFYDVGGESPTDLQPASSVAGERGLLAVSQAMDTGQIVQAPDIPADDVTAFERSHGRAGVRALLAVPMASRDVARAMVVYRRTPGSFDERAVELLTALANQSTVAIDHARLFKEVEEKRHQLEVASRHKSDFLANVSHELRTPLNAILGFNELVLGEVYGEVSPDLKVPLTDIQNSGRHLLRLINNVLDLSKIEAGHMELALADYAVADVVDSVRNSLRSLATEKGLDLLAAVADDIPVARGDPGRITQCLMNLAGNALKFTHQGHVVIAAELHGDQLHYRVIDTGIGIPKERLETVFEEFRQGDAMIAREFGGTGLGLSITRKFVEMHGGRLWAESEVGNGSIFSFAIPLRVESERQS